MQFAEILTTRLRLRMLELSDAQDVYSYRSLPDVCRFQSWGSTSVEEVQRTIVAMSSASLDSWTSWYQLGITLVSKGHLIGDCGFRITEADSKQAEIGITLAPQFQSQGYATEALFGVLGFLFDRGRMHRVFGSVDPSNAGSVALLQRVGMRQEAHFVKSLWFKGEWVDDVVFAMLETEWCSHKQQAPPPTFR